MKTYIYCLLDPNTGKCRYVGKTNNIAERYRNHLRESKKKNLYKHNWIQQLLNQSKKPVLQILEECDETGWADKEKWWIRYFKKNKQPLTNLTEGGDGVVLFRKRDVSEETKKKISNTLMGHSVSEETRQKMSINTKTWIEKNGHPMLGKKASSETLLKQSTARRGLKLSPEHRNNVKLAVQQRGDIRKDITFERILQQCKIHNFKQPKICEYFKCDRHTLTHKIQKQGYKNWLDFRNKQNPGTKIFKVCKKPSPKNLLFEEILQQAIKYDFKLTKVSIHFDCPRHFIVKIVRKNGYKDWKDFKEGI